MNGDFCHGPVVVKFRINVGGLTISDIHFMISVYSVDEILLSWNHMYSEDCNILPKNTVSMHFISFYII